MITDTDKQIIQQIADKYRVKRVVLFGSSLSPEKEGQDIDIGVEGIDERDFFAFYGDLMCAVSKPIDVVDLSKKSLFTDIIQQEGITLYG